MEGLDNTPPKGRITYRVVPVEINAANTPIKNKQYTLDNTIERVTGVSISADKMDNDARFYDLNIGLTIDGKQILPADFEGALLACAASVPTAERFLAINDGRGGGAVEVVVRDRATVSGTYPYKVYITLRCIAN